MTVDDAPGTVTIYRRGRTGLYADDQGVTVRNPASRTRRIGWAEISCFADGSRWSEGSYFWVLHIVLNTGDRVMVMAPPTPETLAAIRQVAARYRIPADLAGVPVVKGRPADRGLYEDPGGREGLRYWDGRVWSPLLPLDIGTRRTVRTSLGSWSALPTAEGRWTGAKTGARRAAAHFTLAAGISAGLVAWCVLNELGFYHVTQHEHWNVGTWLSVYGFAALFGLAARRSWRDRKFLLKVHEAANGSAGRR
jgi:Bacterial PH domain/Protein of unknown function (DUF2510)